jgi:hypothetical protein
VGGWVGGIPCRVSRGLIAIDRRLPTTTQQAHRDDFELTECGFSPLFSSLSQPPFYFPSRRFTAAAAVRCRGAHIFTQLRSGVCTLPDPLHVHTHSL